MKRLCYIKVHCLHVQGWGWGSLLISSVVQAAPVRSTNRQWAGELSRPVQPRKQKRCYTASCQDTHSSTPQQHLFIYFCDAWNRIEAVKIEQPPSLSMDQILTVLQRRCCLNTESRHRKQQQFHSKPVCILLCSLSVPWLGLGQQELARAPLALLHVHSPDNEEILGRNGCHAARHQSCLQIRRLSTLPLSRSVILENLVTVSC